MQNYQLFHNFRHTPAEPDPFHETLPNFQELGQWRNKCGACSVSTSQNGHKTWPELINCLHKRKPLVQSTLSCISNHKNISILGRARLFHNNRVKEKVPGNSMLSIIVLQDLTAQCSCLLGSHCFKSVLLELFLTPLIINVRSCSWACSEELKVYFQVKFHFQYPCLYSITSKHIN
jgi:hypothetical protein